MKLRPYQQEAVDKALSLLRNGGGFGLWLEQRTGKTRTALEIVAAVCPTHLWVICPKAAGAGPRVWWREITQCQQIHPQLKKLTIRVENYEQTVAHRKERYAEARKLLRLMVICDESHYIKKRGTARSMTVRHLGRYARWRLALTGTPIAQGIQDAWSQFDFIDPAIFGRYDDKIDKKTQQIVEEGFDTRHIIWGGYNNRDIVGYRAQEVFYHLFHAHSYRITLREAREERLLIRHTETRVSLLPAARKVYESLKHELVAEVNKYKIKVKNVLACLVKLQQVTGGFVIEQPGGTQAPTQRRIHAIGREKADALYRLVRRLKARTKFIVVARFLHEIDFVASALRKRGFGVKTVRGGEAYDGKFDCDCLVMQIQSGIAVDMSQADTIIFYSIDFSVLNFEQARFRILNFDKPLGHYYFLTAIDTVDEDIYAAITRKKNVAKLICDHYRNRGKQA